MVRNQLLTHLAAQLLADRRPSNIDIHRTIAIGWAIIPAHPVRSSISRQCRSMSVALRISARASAAAILRAIAQKTAPPPAKGRSCELRGTTHVPLHPKLIPIRIPSGSYEGLSRGLSDSSYSMNSMLPQKPHFIATSDVSSSLTARTCYCTRLIYGLIHVCSEELLGSEGSTPILVEVSQPVNFLSVVRMPGLYLRHCICMNLLNLYYMALRMKRQ